MMTASTRTSMIVALAILALAAGDYRGALSTEARAAGRADIIVDFERLPDGGPTPGGPIGDNYAAWGIHFRSIGRDASDHFEIQPEAGPPACQPEVTNVRIVRLQPVGNSFSEVGEVSKVTVGDVFTIKVEVTNRGSTPVTVTNLYHGTLSGQGDADVVGELCVCLFLQPLQPGESATLEPFCGCHAFQATTAGWVTMDITVGADCHDSITFQVVP
jgi:hypothetical protein